MAEAVSLPNAWNSSCLSHKDPKQASIYSGFQHCWCSL